MQRHGVRLLAVVTHGGAGVVVLEQVRLGLEVPEEEEAGDGSGEEDEYHP
jgi:hypothetical protein